MEAVYRAARLVTHCYARHILDAVDYRTTSYRRDIGFTDTLHCQFKIACSTRRILILVNPLDVLIAYGIRGVPSEISACSSPGCSTPGRK